MAKARSFILGIKGGLGLSAQKPATMHLCPTPGDLANYSVKFPIPGVESAV